MEGNSQTHGAKTSEQVFIISIHKLKLEEKQKIIRCEGVLVMELDPRFYQDN